MAVSDPSPKLPWNSGGGEGPGLSERSLQGEVRLLRWLEVNPDESLQLLVANREHLSRWDPLRPDSYFTAAGQADVGSRVQQAVNEGREYVAGILAGERLVGRIALTGIERGVFQSCHLGYWVARDQGGRGYATQAVSAVVQVAFGRLKLHRVEAAVMPPNRASLRVLEKCHFRREGLAGAYLKIQGQWEDHWIYARTAD
ncbi:MAG: GNAT family N-acetyltransferase [Candidatus Dormibacteria bacterium]